VFYITGGPRDLMPYIPTIIELIVSLEVILVDPFITAFAIIAKLLLILSNIAVPIIFFFLDTGG
jgi:hypothetical protein